MRQAAIAIAAGLAVLVTAGSSGATPKLCVDSTWSGLIFATTKSSARSRARVAWAEKVRGKYGAEYADWRTSKRKSPYCRNCGLKKNQAHCEKMGFTQKYGWICSMTAYPCRR